jgi:hypothetical protein
MSRDTVGRVALLEDTVRLRDLPAAAWLVSSAFVCKRWQSRLLTLVGWPVFALTLLPAVVLGGAYWRERNGLVLLYRWRPLADVLLIIVAIVAAIVCAVAAMVWWAGFVVLVVLGVVWFDAGVIVVVICKGVDSAATVVGRGTPKGQRWVIAALAQRPGTRLTAVLLAKDLVAKLPSGAVLVAAAADEGLLARYVGLGFTAGYKRRVHRVIP